jgi:branched-chain amino acid transport system permease protein
MDPSYVASVLLAGIITGSLYGLMAMGLNVIYGVLHLLNIAHGEFIMVAAYITYWLFKLYGINPLLSIPASIGVVCILGLAIYKITLAKVVRTQTLEDAERTSLLVFFGIVMILQNSATILWTSQYRGYFPFNVPLYVLGTTIFLNKAIAFSTAIALSILVFIFIFRTQIGRAVRAVSYNRVYAGLSGINVEKIFLIAIALGCSLTAITGSLLSMIYEISPFMGFKYTMIAFVVITIGGLGNMVGSLIGGLLIGVVESLCTVFLAPALMETFAYLLLILLLLIRPQGLFR